MKGFKWVTGCVALLFTYLFGLLLLDSQSFLADVGLVATEEAEFIAKRASVLMLGMGLFCLSGIWMQDQGSRNSLSLTMVVVMTGLISLGLYEWSRGVVNEGIFVAIITESVILVLYTLLLLSGNKKDIRVNRA